MRLRKIEAALEKVIDGPFGRLLGGPLHPIEIYQQLWRAVEDGCVLSSGATYAPNRLTARIAPDSFKWLEGIRGRLQREFEIGLEEEAEERGWDYGFGILVRLQADEAVRPGHVEAAGHVEDSPIPAVLEAESGPSAGQIYKVTPSVVLGRSTEADIQIADSAVSRRHCRFDWLFKGYQVTDLDSSNGTFVRDTRITQYMLRHNDIISVGTTRLRFEYERDKAWPTEDTT